MEYSNLDLCEKEALFFKALAHPTRVFIVKQLALKEHCVCEIVDKLDVKFATISQHLSVLKNAGIVSVDKRGKEVYYSLNCPCILELFKCISRQI
ncbi:MAG: metalloregulator ArsR/SmtB family transcription factor [Opitutales bacterium]